MVLDLIQPSKGFFVEAIFEPLTSGFHTERLSEETTCPFLRVRTTRLEDAGKVCRDYTNVK